MSEFINTKIGLMPKHWKIIPFNKALKVKGRVGWKGYKTSDLRNDGPVVVGGTNIKANLYLDFSQTTYLSREKFEESPEIILNKGDVILVTRGNGIGDVGYYDGQFSEATINPSLVILSQFVGNPKYLFYYLNSPQGRFQVLSIEGGTSIPALYQGYINTLFCPFPPEDEQNKIVEILSSLDEKINILHRQNKTLEQLAETLFRQWFVEEAEESWEVGTLEDEFDFIMGQSPLGETLNENGDGIIFYQGRTDFGFRFPEPRVYTTAATRIANKFDTLVSVRAPVGDMNIAFEKCCLGRGVAAFRYKHNPDYYSYTYYKLRSLMMQIKQFEDNGTVFGSIGKDDFKNLENVVPPNELVLIFQNEISPLDQKIYNNINQIRTLTNLRDTLLPKLMSGEVRIGNILKLKKGV